MKKWLKLRIENLPLLDIEIKNLQQNYLGKINLI